MLMDVTHINDIGFWEVMDIVKGPVISTHSNCRALCDHPRNFTDEMIKAVADRGGVMGVLHFCFGALDETNLTAEHILDHLDHMVKVGGIECAGFGFDFYKYLLKNLSPEENKRLPISLSKDDTGNDLTKDEDVPLMLEALDKRGYTEAEIDLLLGGNFIRLFKSVWD
jgi:membrane dipeptidase